LIRRPGFRVKIATVIPARSERKNVTWYASSDVNFINSPPVLQSRTAITTRATGGSFVSGFDAVIVSEKVGNVRKDFGFLITVDRNSPHVNNTNCGKQKT